MSSGKRFLRFENLKSVERQYLVAEMAISALEAALRAQPALLTETGLGTADLVAFKINLLDTYLVRIFADFETALKDYWKHGVGRDPKIRIMDVIDSLASRHQIKNAVRLNVHAVRKRRNRIVHDEDMDATAVDLSSARRFLNQFLGYLPDDW